jgi:hypothetical protein
MTQNPEPTTGERPTVQRPAGLDALLEHVAAGLVVEEPHGPNEQDAILDARQALMDQVGAALPSGRLAVLDGRDALAFVIIRPSDNDPDSVQIDAGSPHLSKAATAYALREVADRLDDEARAEGDEPIPHAAAVGLPQILEHMAASTRAHQTGPTHNAYRAGLRVAARLARQYAQGRTIVHDALLDVLAEELPDEPRQSAVLTALADTLYDEERPPDEASAEAAARIVLAEHARELADGLREKQGHPGSLTYFPDTAPGMERAESLLELYARKVMLGWPVATASTVGERD